MSNLELIALFGSVASIVSLVIYFYPIKNSETQGPVIISVEKSSNTQVVVDSKNSAAFNASSEQKGKVKTLSKLDNTKSIGEVWSALLSIDSYLQKDFVEIIYHTDGWEPSKWTIIHDNIKIIQARATKIPSELYKPSWDLINPKLEDNVNLMMGVARELLEARKRGDRLKESEILIRFNRQMDRVILEYHDGILKLKPLYEKYL